MIAGPTRTKVIVGAMISDICGMRKAWVKYIILETTQRAVEFYSVAPKKIVTVILKYMGTQIAGKLFARR